MPGNVALSGDVVMPTTPLINLSVVFMCVFPFVRTLVCLIIRLVFVVPFLLEILLEFLAAKLFVVILNIKVNFRQKLLCHRARLMVLF